MLVVVIKSWLYDPGFHLTLGILLAHVKGLFGQKFSLCAVSLLYSLCKFTYNGETAVIVLTWIADFFFFFFKLAFTFQTCLVEKAEKVFIWCM